MTSTLTFCVVSFLFCFCLCSFAAAQPNLPEPPKADRLRLALDALHAMKKKDSLAAIELLDREPSPLLAAWAYSDLLNNQLYWKDKDLQGIVLIGRAGAQYALAAAARVESQDPRLAYTLRGLAKGMCYDVGSFTWPGWDEPGIHPTARDLAIGLDAAKANMRLAIELKKGDVPLARAYWLLGAQFMAAGDLKQARAMFELSGPHAKAGNLPDEVALAEGYAYLADLLANPGSAAAREGLARCKETLKTSKDADTYIGQLESAWKVFGPKVATDPDKK